MTVGGHVDEVDVARVALGDRAAFHALYERHGRAVRSLTAHMVGAADADDVLPEVFATLWLKARQYDPGRGAFTPWFMAVTRRRCIQLLRRRGRQPQVRASDAVETLLLARPDDRPGPEQAAALNEQSDVLRRALAALPHEQRRVLLLAYFGGMSQSEIAAATGAPPGTVKRRVQLGVQKSRLALKDQSAPERLEVISAERWP